jgi:hypothetical protein
MCPALQLMPVLANGLRHGAAFPNEPAPGSLPSNQSVRQPLVD